MSGYLTFYLITCAVIMVLSLYSVLCVESQIRCLLLLLLCSWSSEVRPGAYRHRIGLAFEVGTSYSPLHV